VKIKMPATLVTAMILLLAGVPSRARQRDSQHPAPAKPGQGTASPDKNAVPFPQVPRIAAEEVQRLFKDGKVVLVDTDDSESYEAEHIKGAVNIAFDPTAEARAQDQMLSALPGDRLIVFYCNCAHEEDSAPFVLEMWELGYDHDKVKALKGGLTRWEQLGYPLAGTDLDATRQKGR